MRMEHARVGAAEGDCEGKRVGEYDGRAEVGECVGLNVGSAVGESVVGGVGTYRDGERDGDDVGLHALTLEGS